MRNVVAAIKLPREQIKLALIPLLGLVLVAVLFWPSGTHVKTEVKRAARPVLTSASATALPPTHRLPWPQTRLEDVAAFNPFNPPAPVPTQVPSNTEQTLATNALHGNSAKEETPEPVLVGRLQAVYQTANGTVAILDSQIVRVGDILSDGSRIVEITEQAILVDRN